MAKAFKEIQKKILNNPYARDPAMNNISFKGDIYVFGIWSGVSLNHEINYMEKKKIDYNAIYGFDSFIGFPKEEGQKYFIIDMVEGGFSSAELYDCKPEEAASIIDKGIDCDKLVLVPGYFSDVLNDDLVQGLQMKPASFVDIDADLYTSTIEALEFMFSNKLIITGTIVYFDDWGATGEYAGGESLAWKELTEKYNIKHTQIFSIGSKRSIQKVFKIL